MVQSGNAWLTKGPDPWVNRPGWAVRRAIDQSWEVLIVHWDIGGSRPRVLAAYSLGFGLIAQFVMWKSTY